MMTIEELYQNISGDQLEDRSGHIKGRATKNLASPTEAINIIGSALAQTRPRTPSERSLFVPPMADVGD
jgi:hypothetical protein